MQSSHKIKSGHFSSLTLHALLISILVGVTTLSGCGSDEGTSDHALEQNDSQFQRKGVAYFGDVGVAISLNIGYADKRATDAPVALAKGVIPLQEALEEKNLSQRKIIASHINQVNAYRDLLKINLREKLDESSDRQATLTTHLSLLARNYEQAKESMASLESSRSEISNALTQSTARAKSARGKVDDSFARLDPSDVDGYVGDYVSAKEDEIFAQTYLVLTDRLRERYTRLQSYNSLLIQSISTNKQALVTGVTVIMPNAGNALLDDLGLIKTEEKLRSGE